MCRPRRVKKKGKQTLTDTHSRRTNPPRDTHLQPDPLRASTLSRTGESLTLSPKPRSRGAGTSVRTSLPGTTASVFGVCLFGISALHKIFRQTNKLRVPFCIENQNIILCSERVKHVRVTKSIQETSRK